jgi:hypothetical protein
MDPITRANSQYSTLQLECALKLFEQIKRSQYDCTQIEAFYRQRIKIYMVLVQYQEALSLRAC